MRALIIDDSRTMRAVLARMMRELGFDILEAVNGREGLEALRAAGSPDLILVDWNMPELNGLDFIKAVRSDRAQGNVCIAMVTTESELEQLLLAREAGANAYVMKPFTKEVLVEKLELMGILRT